MYTERIVVMITLPDVYKKLCCCRDAARCFVSVSSQLQQYNTYLERSLLLLVIAASDLQVGTIKLCSVVFGVTLRLLVINTSSPANNKRRRLIGISVTKLSRFGAAVYNIWRWDR